MDSHLDLEKGHRPIAVTLQTRNYSTATTDSTQSVSSTGSDGLLLKGSPSQARDHDHAKSKSAGRIARHLRHNFTVYRRVFTLIFVVNVAVFIALLAVARGKPSAAAVGNAAAVNLAVGVAFRQEQVVNFCFWVLTSAPHSWPLGIRVQLARVFHYGGFHSGCGVAAVVWYLLYTALATQEYLQDADDNSIEALCTSWILVGLFVTLLGGAYPAFRVRFHDYFEVLHRFAGWAALAVFWAHVLFTAHSSAAATSTPMGLVLVRSVPFWCILLATLPVVGSWAQLRRRTVRVEALSSHATRLCFDYADLPPCYGVRVSTNPLIEWHSFATIPGAVSTADAPPATQPRLTAAGSIVTTDASSSSSNITISASTVDTTITTTSAAAAAAATTRGFSIVVSNAGDWTRRTIRAPPERLWVRGSPLRGVIFAARLFTRVVVVATGSGIGPCLSLLVAHAALLPRRPRVLWSAAAPQSTFGSRLVADVHAADPDALIWDTRERGRPDLVGLAARLAAESGAEAVFCVSNPSVCRKLVDGLGDRGIPAYAPIFDS